MPEFERLYQQIVANASTKTAQGQAFEKLMKHFFCEAPEWKQRFSSVWLWDEWAEREGPDTGIDLVAKDKNGGYCAIQCKAYARNHTLQKGDIDSFFTASGKTQFTSRVIVSTAEHWGKNVKVAIEDQNPPVSCLDFLSLADHPFDWPNLDTPEKLRYTGTKKQLRAHQQTAVDAVMQGFKTHDRGQMIMACGTGKTFTALKLAERLVGKGGRVLFLVPSIALISQAMREWSCDQDTIPHRYMAVCSDAKAGQGKTEDTRLSELVYPPKTHPQALATELQEPAPQAMTVVFSTYQSLAVVHQAQQLEAVEEPSPFDLVICDEAHRTTGVDVIAGGSAFAKIHDQNYIHASKRLYMTATPRLYSESAKRRAVRDELTLSSMDDMQCYGPEFHRLDFSKAIEEGLLVDYKVLILVVDEASVAGQMAAFMADKEGLPLGDTARLIGCWNALAKRTDTQHSDFGSDTQPMRRAVAFANTIKNSQTIAGKFTELVNAYQKDQPLPQPAELACKLWHVDGTMGAVKRNKIINWLRTTDNNENSCRIVSNVRCLSEGVDVPSLDAVIFTQPRKSQVDVVQSVGRVMRKAPGKQYGYVILPIAVNNNTEPETALNENQTYRVVWEVLQALRAHDNRFNALINKLDLNQTPPPQIQIIGVGSGGSGDNEPASADASNTKRRQHAVQEHLRFGIEEWRKALYARIVTTCGDRHYWEDWVDDVAKISQRNITRIHSLVQGGTADHRDLFDEFLSDLQKNINPSINTEVAIEMLSQHAITKPVFDALFEGYRFAEHNPVSKSLQSMLELLEEQHFERETETLQKFYDSVRQRASGIDNPEGRQRILLELYDKFFAKAFKRDAERLGIVFTPVEIVDFILNSTDHLLRECFGERLSNEGVHILEPFVGTGTFMARLIQSDLIPDADIKRKYSEELHANELVLLSYYIAAVNIEESYHQRCPDAYVSFPGIVLTDTFQINENDDKPGDTKQLKGGLLDKNPERIQKQKAAPIWVIISNPPYSIGQKSQNDANQNLKYPRLDERIKDTYAKHSSAGSKKGLYDSYIRALRWACDRIGKSGLVAFVTNGGFIDSASADGLRKCLAKECARVYIYNLRGNARTSGEQRRKEKDNVFEQGSRTPIAITLLVKDERHHGAAEIYYHDIGNYLTREKKLAAIGKAKHIGNLPWQRITPNPAGDWINQRGTDFTAFLPLGLKENKKSHLTTAPEPSVFTLYSNGVATNRDAWAYNHDRAALAANMARMIAEYNQQRHDTKNTLDKADRLKSINRDPTKISWSRSLKQDLAKDKAIAFKPETIRRSMYRPFCRQYLYFDRRLNEMMCLQPKFFPEADSDNRAICVSGTGASKAFSALMVNVVPDLNSLDAGCQCFPRYTYAEVKVPEAVGEERLLRVIPRQGRGGTRPLERQDNIPAATLAQFQAHYADQTITREAIFTYIYGVLHSPDYRERYANDLRKMLPRVPFAPDFWALSRAGERLATLHLDYETVAEYPLEAHYVQRQLPLASLGRNGDGDRIHGGDCKDGARETRANTIKKMRFGGTPQKPDRSRIVCNATLTLSGIPKAAYDYQVNGKSAIEWIMDRYQYRKDKDSDIVNDPNTNSTTPDYIPSLLKRVVTVSLESVAIVQALPNIS